MCLIIFTCLVSEFTAFQQQDSPIQLISIRKSVGAPRPFIGRQAKTNTVKHTEEDPLNTKITIIEKFPQITTPIPWKYVNKRKSKFHPATGAYPVYYALAKVNGNFKGNRIWLLPSQ